MSGGPDLELQGVISQRLKVDAALVALTGINARIFQDVPEDPTYPYITIGQSQIIPAKAECINASEIIVTINAYTKSRGYQEIKRIAQAICDSLDEPEPELQLTEHRLLLLERDNVLFRAGEGELVKQAIITIRGFTEPTDF